MCGIIGYIGTKNAVPIIVEGLKKLEYRGYDSSGIAVSGTDCKCPNVTSCGTSGFCIVKKRGRLFELEKALKANPISGKVGIGHTRWATHGEPSDINSHPHLSQNSSFAIVHNGIIENYKELRERLENRGIKFSSATDSEVVAQLAAYYKQKFGGSLIDVVARVVNRLEGSFALGLMCASEPDVLIAVKKDNPLIVGVSDSGNFIASDVPAVLGHTDKVYYFEDKEIAVLKKDSVEFFSINAEPIDKKLEVITWDAGAAEKGGYEHFMLKEMLEQPKVIIDTFNNAGRQLLSADFKNKIDISEFNKIVITACGSAYNAGMVGKYVLEKLARVPVEVELASEFRYKEPLVDSKTLVILISQSGETADTIAAMREAKRLGAITLGIVNVVGSSIAKECDVCVYTAAGPEIAVATTKAFSCQLMVLYQLAIYFATALNKIDSKEKLKLESELKQLSSQINEVLSLKESIQKYASKCIRYKSIFFIGRNIDYAISLEGSLKLKEISYIHSEAYAGGELKHGTISLIEEETLVVAIATCPRLLPKIMSNVEQVISRGATVMLITDEAGALAAKKMDNKRMAVLTIPPVSELFSPSLSVIALQLFSYYVAANKGLDIDKPRNLAKSVTVE